MEKQLEPPAAEPQPEVKQIQLVIFRSPNGRDHWRPIKSHEVPAWVKEPDVMARMVAGEKVMKCNEFPSGSDWYGALTPEAAEMFLKYNAAALEKAQEKRARKAARRIEQVRRDNRAAADAVKH